MPEINTTTPNVAFFILLLSLPVPDWVLDARLPLLAVNLCRGGCKGLSLAGAAHVELKRQGVLS